MALRRVEKVPPEVRGMCEKKRNSRSGSQRGIKSAICHSGTLRHEVARTCGKKKKPNTDYCPLCEITPSYTQLRSLKRSQRRKRLCMSTDRWEATQRTDNLHRRKIIKK